MEIEKTLNHKKLNNSVHLNNSITFSELARRCILVIGYNTTAVVEMMVTEVPIIVPHFAEAAEDPTDNMFDVNTAQSAYYVAENQFELQRMIEEILFEKKGNPSQFDSRAERKKIIEKFIYRIDGRRSEAVAEIIKDTIQKNTEAY